jgi:hypothetical protein
MRCAPVELISKTVAEQRPAYVLVNNAPRAMRHSRFKP